jgi:hypothetical protein
MKRFLLSVIMVGMLIPAVGQAGRHERAIMAEAKEQIAAAKKRDRERMNSPMFEGSYGRAVEAASRGEVARITAEARRESDEKQAQTAMILAGAGVLMAALIGGGLLLGLRGRKE